MNLRKYLNNMGGFMKAIIELERIKNKLEKYKSKNIKRYFLEKLYYLKFIKKLSLSNNTVLDYNTLYELAQLLFINGKPLKYKNINEETITAKSKIFNYNMNGTIYITTNKYQIIIKLFYKYGQMEITIEFEYNDKLLSLQTNYNLSHKSKGKYNKKYLNLVNIVCIDCYNSLLRRIWKDNILIKDAKGGN